MVTAAPTHHCRRTAADVVTASIAAATAIAITAATAIAVEFARWPLSAEPQRSYALTGSSGSGGRRLCFRLASSFPWSRRPFMGQAIASAAGFSPTGCVGFHGFPPSDAPPGGPCVAIVVACACVRCWGNLWLVHGAVVGRGCRPLAHRGDEIFDVAPLL